MHAAWFGHIDVMRILIDKGADVNAKSSTGDTALIRASKYGHPDVVNIQRNVK
ncbi:MAG: hypothetical protein C0392_13605 [Syntrophus sp. (in: bacteria)]|nr:hypothetical protein [Syntrophus sp. (in: bacteria)]